MDVKDFARQAVIAAAYAAISLALAPISFMALQFRLAEALMVLPFFNRKHTIGLTLGCLITNMFSPLGLVDVVFGTSATFIACMIISRLDRMRFVALVAALVNGVIVGLELNYMFQLPLLFSMATVAAGEFAVVQLGVFAMAAVNKTGLIKILQ